MSPARIFEEAVTAIFALATGAPVRIGCNGAAEETQGGKTQ